MPIVGYTKDRVDQLLAAITGRTITAGTGLTGGGALTASRTLNVAYGTATGTAAQGNDGRLSDARVPLTHTHVVASVTDFVEAWQDRLGSDLVAGTGVTLSYDDAGTGRVTISASAAGGTTDPEIVRDVIGAALVAGTGVQITVNDAGDSVTIAALAPTAAGTSFTPTGAVAATNVQAAIVEVDAEKVGHDGTITAIRKMTQAAYDALATKVATTLYVIEN